MLDTREFGRRPGVQVRRRLSAPAPVGLGNEVVGVAAESEVELDVRLESVLGGVLATGTASVQVSGECVRCLERLDRELTVEFQELYVHADGADDDADSDDDEETHRLGDDDLLDLEPVIRDAVVLALPFQPVCQDDCPGLCVECGARLADDPEHRHDAGVDPRWAALAHLARTEERDDDAGTTGSTKE